MLIIKSKVNFRRKWRKKEPAKVAYQQSSQTAPTNPNIPDKRQQIKVNVYFVTMFLDDDVTMFILFFIRLF
jgi:hypothetical protein